MKTYFWSFFMLYASLFSQSISNVDMTKKSLETVLYKHYESDIEKRKAAAFLIDNIEIHYSENYKWVDGKNRKIDFNELDYPDLKLATQAFKKLQDSISLKPELYCVKDLDIITPEFLIKYIDLAFKSWKNNPWSRSYDFKTFCEYILPYRSLTEPLEDWRSEYLQLVSQAQLNAKNINQPVDVATQTILELKNFRFLSSRPDPIPYLSPKQLLFRREGACNDLANLTLLACRAMGLAVTFDFTPEYGASSKRHFWDTVIDENGKHIPFNGNCFGNPQGLPYAYNATEKRLAKVYRKTFSIQQNSLAALKDTLLIPDGFLREKNILDVTHEYVDTGKITYPVNAKNQNEIAYLNVFNLAKWRVIDWGEKKGNTIEFKNLGSNIVYLPSFYDPTAKKMNYARYPVLLDNNTKQQILIPNYNKTFSYSVSRDKPQKAPGLDFNSFEVFENEIFTLYVWDNGWKKLEEATSERDFIKFSKIPDNALLLALCPKSNGYERIFRINSETKQIEWY
ncbi:transglutaminase-like domain-containing protein [Flavobacterium sp. 2]|uniref:transglutaminase-like domain-containing protein n=1 Tax=Flavobacterium sp. 2 TaxID=308053 RepID=UPI003CED7278